MNVQNLYFCVFFTLSTHNGQDKHAIVTAVDYAVCACIRLLLESFQPEKKFGRENINHI